MQDYANLKVWQKGHALTLAVYDKTRSFPRIEMFGLTSQIRRACASIPANIAEGCGRVGRRELAYFLNVALGSASELDYHLRLAHDLGMLDDASHGRLAADLVEIKRMLCGLLKKLRDGL